MLAAMIGICTHSCVSEKQPTLHSAIIDGSLRWPPELQFSITRSGSSRRMRAMNACTASIWLRKPSPSDSAPSQPMPMVSL